MGNQCSDECRVAIDSARSIWNHCQHWHLEVLSHGRVIDGAISLCDENAPTDVIKIRDDGHLMLYLEGLW